MGPPTPGQMLAEPVATKGSMPSTGFHRPDPLATTDLEAQALAAADDLGLPRHVLTWYGDILRHDARGQGAREGRGPRTAG